MSKITTELCKEYLVKLYPQTQEGQWKRASKYKDENKVVCRDFLHPQIGSVILQEIDGVLVQKNQTEAVLIPKIKNNHITQEDIEASFENDEVLVAYQPEFSAKELKMLKKYRRFLAWEDFSSEDYEKVEDEEFIEEMINDLGKALPRGFGFFFTHGEDTTVIKHETKIKDFSVFIQPVDSEYDQHCEYLVERFLPLGFSEDMECIFSPVSNESELANKSAIWLYKKLIHAGFVPVFNENENHEDAILMDNFKNIEIISLNKNIANKESHSYLPSDNFDESKEVFTIIKKDNEKELNVLFSQGLDSNMVLNNKNDLANTAITYKAWKCLSSILEQPAFKASNIDVSKFNESLIEKFLMNISDEKSDTNEAALCLVKMINKFDIEKKRKDYLECEMNDAIKIIDAILTRNVLPEFLQALNKLENKLGEDKFELYLTNQIIENIQYINVKDESINQLILANYQKNASKYLSEIFIKNLFDMSSSIVEDMSKALENVDYFIKLMGRNIAQITVGGLPVEKYLSKEIIRCTNEHMESVKRGVLTLPYGSHNSGRNLTVQQEEAKFYSLVRQMVLKVQEPPKIKP